MIDALPLRRSGRRLMTINLTFALILWNIIGCSQGLVTLRSHSIVVHDDTLALVGTKDDGALLVATYADRLATASPYQTDFDRRNLRAISGTDRAFIADGILAADLCDALYSGGELNVSIPARDQVATCEKADTRAHGAWVLRRWVLQYANQRQIGYVTECTIATTSQKIWPKAYFAVSECYPLEEIDRFIQSLDSTLVVEAP